jgi:hypothetical protein
MSAPVMLFGSVGASMAAATGRPSQSHLVYAGTDLGLGSNLDQMSCSARSSGSKGIFEVVYFAVWFRGRPMAGE